MPPGNIGDFSTDSKIISFLVAFSCLLIPLLLSEIGILEEAVCVFVLLFDVSTVSFFMVEDWLYCSTDWASSASSTNTEGLSELLFLISIWGAIGCTSSASSTSSDIGC